MLVSSADILGTATIAATRAIRTMSDVRETNPREAVSLLEGAERNLVQALAELRAARWGITRRMPQFDTGDLEVLLSHEEQALKLAHGHIPAQ